MVKLNNLKKKAKELTEGTPLTGYIHSTFIRAAQREFLLLQHLPTEVRGEIIRLAEENYSLHISKSPEDSDDKSPEDSDEMADLALAGIMDHQRGWIRDNFGFFSKTISELINPRYSWNKWGDNSDLWGKFWEVQTLKFDFFEEQFPSDQDGIRSEDPALTDDFSLPGTWSSGMDKNIREFIINFSDWGEVIYYFDPIKSKPGRKIRWALMERFKQQFLDKKIELPAAQVKTKPVKSKVFPQQDDLNQKLTEEQLNRNNEIIPGKENDISTSLPDFQNIQILFEQYIKNVGSLPENIQTTNPIGDHAIDGRKKNNQNNKIMPEPKFWDEVKRYTGTYSTAEWKNSKGAPTDKFKDHLLSKKFNGYKASDKKFENPTPLNKYIIRERLIEHFQGK